MKKVNWKWIKKEYRKLSDYKYKLDKNGMVDVVKLYGTETILRTVKNKKLTEQQAIAYFRTWRLNKIQRMRAIKQKSNNLKWKRLFDERT